MNVEVSPKKGCTLCIESAKGPNGKSMKITISGNMGDVLLCWVALTSKVSETTKIPIAALAVNLQQFVLDFQRLKPHDGFSIDLSRLYGGKKP